MSYSTVAWATALACTLLLLQTTVLAGNVNVQEPLDQFDQWSQLSSLMLLSAAASPNSTQCERDVAALKDAFKAKDFWAIQMADATGKIPSGILIGNTLEMGSFSQCTFSNIVANRSDNTTYTPQFCMSYMKANLTGLAPTSSANFWMGLCLPESCSTADVVKLVQKAINKTADYEQTAFIAERFTATKAVCQKKTLDYTAWGICALTFISIILAVVVCATIYDLYRAYRCKLEQYYRDVQYMSSKHYKLQSGSQESLAIVNSGNVEGPSYSTYAPQETTNGTPRASVVSVGSTSNGTVGSTANGHVHGHVATNAKEQHDQPSLAGRILLCFSLYTNGEKLMNTDPPKTAGGDDQIGCAHGIRFISMTWVILGHTFFVLGYVTFNGLNPVTQFKQFVDYWGFMAVTSGILSVDTFFTMSGLLTCYLTLKGLHKLGGPRKLNWGMFYLHRYLRLTPVYAVALFVIMPLFRHLYYGPIWPQDEALESQCANYWWTNMLYINNLVHDNPPCMGHTWYLANDMQFYIISPLVMIPWFYNAVAGFVVSTLLVVVSVVSTAVIVSERHYSANILKPGPAPEGFYQSMFHDVYTKPYSRVGTYAVGMMAGYLMYRISLEPARKERFLVVQRGRLIIANLVGWAIAAFFCISAVYGPFEMQSGDVFWSDAMNAFYMSTARLAWSVGVCYVIMSCAYGYGGWVNRFLSWRFFIPLSRLTYAAYLVHLYVIEFLYYSAEQPISLSVIYVVYYYFGHIAISYTLAFGLSMMFEAPMFCLEKILFKR